MSMTVIITQINITIHESYLEHHRGWSMSGVSTGGSEGGGTWSGIVCWPGCPGTPILISPQTVFASACQGPNQDVNRERRLLPTPVSWIHMILRCGWWCCCVFMWLLCGCSVVLWCVPLDEKIMSRHFFYYCPALWERHLKVMCDSKYVRWK